MKARVKLGVLTLAALGLGGCVDRTLTVDSEPQGELVYLNDQEVGRTPFARDFVWYGTYDVVLRKEGHETLKARAPVIAPFWQWVPFDLIAEILPLRLRDEHKLTYQLEPVSKEDVDPQQLVQRGAELRGKLETGVNTKQPTTAATKPAKKPVNK